MKFSHDLAQPNRVVKHHDVHCRPCRIAGSIMLSVGVHVFVTEALMP